MSSKNLIRSLNKDVQETVKTVITGKVPEWVNGTLYRNGPARYKYGEKEYKHLFDGHACIHKFKIENGSVTYENRLLETEHFKKVKTENRLYPVFGTSDICSNLYGRLQTVFFNSSKNSSNMDNTNVNVMPFGNDLYALTESNMMCKIDPKNLDVLKSINITKYIPKATTTFAHPQFEEDGSWICVGMNTKEKKPHYNFIRYKVGQNSSENIGEQAELIASLPTSHSNGLSYFHSLGLTENYIVFLEMPLVFDFTSFLIGLVTNRSFCDNLHMYKQFQTRVHLLNRKTNKFVTQEFETEPMFVFHHINAYENKKSNEIFVDVVAYDVNEFEISKLTFKDSFLDLFYKSTARRIVVPMDKINSAEKQRTKCEVKEINPDISIELPIINFEKVNGMPYKYVYGANLYSHPFSIVKQNVDDKNDILEMKYTSEDGEKCLPTEPVFVINPNATSEDDGVLLVMVLANKNDFLSVLDAKTLKEIARANIPEEARGAFTFHGFFADKAKYGQLNQ